MTEKDLMPYVIALFETTKKFNEDCNNNFQAALDSGALDLDNIEPYTLARAILTVIAENWKDHNNKTVKDTVANLRHFI